MQEIPDCLNRRYKVLDELVKELNSASKVDCNDDVSGVSCNDPGVRLMCDFWNILKENPDCNLTKAVQNRMNLSPKSSMFRPQNVSCYMAAHNCSRKDDDTKKPESGGKVIKQCCHKGPEQIKSKCCGSKSVSSSQDSTDVLPLSKVLCNLNEAASFDRKCQGMVNDLVAAQKQLQDQIQHLEHREEEGVQLLKKADCMWSCMEDAYKKKILESQERQQELIKQLKEAEANTNKWRKNKKDLEFQMENINTCHQEISEKLQQKQNDLKCMNRDIADYKKRIENNKKEIEAAKKAVTTKKHASDDKIKKISGDITRREAMIREEKAHKEEKENEGNQYIREARADLLNLSKILLQKRIENEDMKTEKETLLDELEILSQSYDQCKDRCQFKKQSIEDEIKKIDNEIAHYHAKCLRCHQCTDTIDIRKFCTDCPKCLEERECLYKEDHCSPDHTMDCVCMSVKQKFLDNVFENMYTVLERQIKTGPGKCVAETVLNCLKRSRNGKLDQATRQILQDFILTTVKKNLNLTIVGGAVKTRCELDSETYKQLMLCLKQVKAVRPPKADKQTAAKKPPCPRWGGESECNCPKGPKACICTKRAPAPPNEPGPCPPQDKEDKGEEKICPHKESAACGPDCAMHAVPSAVGTDVAAWRPDPCQGPTCMFKNMRAAQCVLGPEALNTKYDSRSFVTAVPYVPNITLAEDQIPCKCGSSPNKPCICKDIKTHPRERIIEEVMGKYFEVKPIDKVYAEKDYSYNDEYVRKNNEDLYIYVEAPATKYIGYKLSSNCSKQYDPYDGFNTAERNKFMIKCKRMSKYGLKGKGDRNDTSRSLKSFDNSKYLKADSKIQLISNPESATTVVTVQSEQIQVTENDTKVIDKNTTDIVRNSGCICLRELHHSLLREKVCSIAQKLVKDVIVFGCNSIQDNSKEWISLETFLKNILNTPQMSKENEDEENNEIEIKTECLESNETTKKHERTRSVIDLDTIYKNKGYKNNRSENQDFRKQMKVDTRTQCNNNVCGIPFSRFRENELNSTITQAQNLHNSVFVQADDSKPAIDITKHNGLSATENVSVDNKLKADLIKEQFQPLLITKSIQRENSIFKGNKEISQNNILQSSETNKLELDERIIEFIEDVTRQDPSSYVSLKKTNSGHLSLGLNVVKDDDGKTILVKRSASGNMIIEIDKSTINNLKSDKCKKMVYRDETTKTENIHRLTSKTCKPQCSKTKNISHDSVRKFLLHNIKEDLSTCEINRRKDSDNFLEDMYNNDLRNIRIMLRNQEQTLANVQATILRISSKCTGIHVKNSNIIEDERLEIPVILQRTEADTLNIVFDADVSTCNAVAMRTPSNGFLIYMKQSKPLKLKPCQQEMQKTQDVFKIKIKGIDNGIKEPPVVIKQTPSGNFNVILEKEYEKYFQQTIRRQPIDGSESCFDISKTSSCVILDLENGHNIRPQSQKGILMKSNSGLLKIIVSDPTQNGSIDNVKRNKSLTFGSSMSAKTLGDLLNKLPSNSNFQKRNSSTADTHKIKSTAPKKTKSSSDSQLYETIKMKLHGNQNILEKSSTTLKKTPSGQFAVVLDKDLKKSFITNILSYLDKTSQGIIPIKRTDSGEIIIAIDKNTGVGESGSLKITSSGNIYIILDEGNIKRISNNVAINTSHNSNKSDVSLYISKIDNPESKAIATSCNKNPEDSLCDASKCVCEWLSGKRDSSGNSCIDSPTDSHKLCEKIKCSGQRDKQSIKSNNKSPHIVIRSCESRPESDKRNKFQESYYCEVHSVCPYHKDRYEAVSNELLEISGSCNKAQEKMVLPKVRTFRKIKQFMPKKNVNYGWDSFEYLPPQLPPFLRNITYS